MRTEVVRLTIWPNGQWRQLAKGPYPELNPARSVEVRSGSYIVKGKDLITTQTVAKGLRWAKEPGLIPGRNYTLLTITHYSLSDSNTLRRGKSY